MNFNQNSITSLRIVILIHVSINLQFSFCGAKPQSVLKRKG